MAHKNPRRLLGGDFSPSKQNPPLYIGAKNGKITEL
jgi:hypothetical protein